MSSLGDWRLLRQIKREVKEHMRVSGFSLIAKEQGIVIPVSAPSVCTEEFIDQLWIKAEAAGELSDDIIVDLSRHIGGFGDGPVLKFLRNIIEWLKDPANRDKILLIVKAIMTILLMFI